MHLIKYINSGYNIFSSALIATVLWSCGGNGKPGREVENTDGVQFTRIDMNLAPDFYDSVINLLPEPELVVLKENDSTMYADLDKLIVRNGKYFVLDSFGARTVVSFTKNGDLLGKYGNVGQGPGEYVLPMDMDVDSSGVYILDARAKKLLKYKETGEFIGEKTIPVIAESFRLLGNGDIMFSIMPDGNGGPRLCITDSLMEVKKRFLPSEVGYVGGWRTNDIFRACNGSTIYYKAPLDTMYLFNRDGKAKNGMVFDFGSRSVPEEAKRDFLSASEEESFKGTRMLANSPIPLANGLMVGIVVEDDSQYVVLFDPTRNRCGGKKCDESGAIFDIIEPIASDENGDLISYISQEYAATLEGYQYLPDTIKSGLEMANRMLLIYSFSSLKNHE